MRTPSGEAAPRGDPADPLFIISVGRSGSTLLHRLLCLHERAAWLTDQANRAPRRLVRHRAVLRAADVPVLGALIRDRFPAIEGYEFWDAHLPGFSTPFRDLRAGDATRSQIEATRAAVAGLVTRRRDRPILKITGWPRVGLLRRAFPRSRFLHIVRDGRAVATSLLAMPWWWGRRGPENWRFGPLSDEDRAAWEAEGRSFLTLAALEWKIVLRAVEEARSCLGEDEFLEIRYEDLCADPDARLPAALAFAGLHRTPLYERRAGGAGIRPAEETWRNELRADQQAELVRVIGPLLERHGYAVYGQSAA